MIPARPLFKKMQSNGALDLRRTVTGESTSSQEPPIP